ncbi:hypothetical protein B0H14DRAFT_2630658 [Mycena olivaceomarginata]|nr:hypothetical protein B0H14DRAFT_2630658 [Mycena olivaceomarginata]
MISSNRRIYLLELLFNCLHEFDLGEATTTQYHRPKLRWIVVASYGTVFLSTSATAVSLFLIDQIDGAEIQDSCEGKSRDGRVVQQSGAFRHITSIWITCDERRRYISGTPGRCLAMLGFVVPLVLKCQALDRGWAHWGHSGYSFSDIDSFRNEVPYYSFLRQSLTLRGKIALSIRASVPTDFLVLSFVYLIELMNESPCETDKSSRFHVTLRAFARVLAMNCRKSRSGLDQLIAVANEAPDTSHVYSHSRRYRDPEVRRRLCNATGGISHDGAAPSFRAWKIDGSAAGTGTASVRNITPLFVPRATPQQLPAIHVRGSGGRCAAVTHSGTRASSGRAALALVRCTVQQAECGGEQARRISAVLISSRQEWECSADPLAIRLATSGRTTSASACPYSHAAAAALGTRQGASQKCARGQAKCGSGGAGSERRRVGKKAGREQADITHEKHVKRPTLTDADGAVGARQAASERVARKRRDA